MIEINWGKPLTFVLSSDGNVQKFSTIEQVKYWLQSRWHVADDAHRQALRQVEGAMERIVPVAIARRAFITASRTAGFVPEGLMTFPHRRPA